MNPTAIFWPMIAHAMLVGIVYGFLGARRAAAVRTGEARISQFKDRSTEPARSASVSANLMNQFELPVLFHVVCIALFVTAGVSYLTVLLAWLFIVLRYVHAGIALFGNDVRLRSPAFAAGAVVLAILWIYLALNLLAVV